MRIRTKMGIRMKIKIFREIGIRIEIVKKT